MHFWERLKLHFFTKKRSQFLLCDLGMPSWSLERKKEKEIRIQFCTTVDFWFKRDVIFQIHLHKGPSLYYVRVFWGFFNHPPTYVRTFSLDKVRENCHFLDQPPTPMSLRNIKMAPNQKKEKLRSCSSVATLVSKTDAANSGLIYLESLNNSFLGI